MIVSYLSRISIHHRQDLPATRSGTDTSLVGRVRITSIWTCGLRTNADTLALPLFPSPSSFPLLPSISTYYGNTTFCDAGQLSPNHPHSRPFHHTTSDHTDFGPAAGAQVCVFFYHPLPFIHSFIHRKEYTLTGFTASNRENPEPFDKLKKK